MKMLHHQYYIQSMPRPANGDHGARVALNVMEAFRSASAVAHQNFAEELPVHNWKSPENATGIHAVSHLDTIANRLTGQPSNL